MPVEKVEWSTFLIAILTVLTGTGGVKIIQRLMDSKDKKTDKEHADAIAFRKSLIKRIEDLQKKNQEQEGKIEQLIKENMELKLALSKFSE